MLGGKQHLTRVESNSVDMPVFNHPPPLSHYELKWHFLSVYTLSKIQKINNIHKQFLNASKQWNGKKNQFEYVTVR